MNRHHFRCLISVFRFLLYALAFLSLSRLLLVIWQYERVAAVDGFAYIMLQGVRFDLVLLCQLLALPIIFVPLLSLYEPTRRVVNFILRGYLLLVATLLIVSELLTPNFITQYDFRPNFLMVEYLVYPKEVLSMLVKAIPVQLLMVVAVLIAMLWVMHRHLKVLETKTSASVAWSAPIIVVVGVFLCVLGARSTLGHRPVNPSTVAFSSDPLANSLVLSSAYSVAYATYEKLRHESEGMRFYDELDEKQVMQEVYDSMGYAESAFPDKNHPTLHWQKASGVNKKNLVIILQESLGADFVGSLGGRDLTPNIDKLSLDGIWFENLYATGTRSVRGIEAVVTGFPPTPLRSVVKLGGSQNNFFTIAQLLAKQGYETSFIYGGEAHFDNMKRFFRNNGFEHIIEQKDYVNPVFKGSWGVSDEDLYQKAHQEFSRLSEAGKPFFSLVFTSSNHSPFEFPEGRVALVEQPKNTVANAIKYADYALGQYIDKAKHSNYWDNTVFLIIADHSDRVYGREWVPVNKFHIPGLILGKGIKPESVTRLVSQIDMLPTLLSLMNVQAAHPAIGIDLTREDLEQIPGRAIMQYDNKQAYMEGNQVVILQYDHAPLQFEYVDKALKASDINQDLVHRALAHSIWPMLAYQHKAYSIE